MPDAQCAPSTSRTLEWDGSGREISVDGSSRAPENGSNSGTAFLDGPRFPFLITLAVLRLGAEDPRVGISRSPDLSFHIASLDVVAPTPCQVASGGNDPTSCTARRRPSFGFLPTCSDIRVMANPNRDQVWMGCRLVDSYPIVRLVCSRARLPIGPSSQLGQLAPGLWPRACPDRCLKGRLSERARAAVIRGC